MLKSVLILLLEALVGKKSQSVTIFNQNYNDSPAACVTAALHFITFTINDVSLSSRRLETGALASAGT